MKAFDTVNHEVLLRKLYNMGIKEKVFDWVKNYLPDRYQRTIANDIISKERLITTRMYSRATSLPNIHK